MQSIEAFNQLLAKTDGRDKIYRLGQYGGRFLGAVLSQKHNPKDVQELGARITKLSSLLSDGRKLFRLWKWANEIPKLPTLLSAKETALLKFVNVGKSLSTLLYFVFDNYIWILKTQIVKGDAARATQRSGLFWFLSIVLAIVGDLYAVLVQGKRDSARLLNLVKNTCDAPIAGNAAVRGSLSPKVSGLLGIGSSLIGLYQVSSGKK